MHQIMLKGVQKSFAGRCVLAGVDLTVAPGETISLIGPSGGGKSTLLRCLNGLESPEQGEILLRARKFPQGARTPWERRQCVGTVFQGFHLFEHLSVLENLNLGPLRVRGFDRETATERSRALLTQVGLSDFEAADVRSLSGGQKQRVALARALAMNPDVLLLDEPTSALDPQSLTQVQKILLELKASGMTLFIVTHEMAFAQQLSDRVFFLEKGRIQAQGSPRELFGPRGPQKVRAFLERG
ncbi:hypothetical protein ABB02_00880 [Clostridiaceae bacterium JG1575]|nr:hypothetical protein ABB02_00880 [Clostridiaceae bacterium JG1575]